MKKIFVKLLPLIVSITIGIFFFYLNFFTYDNYTHLIFAKHYKEKWFSTKIEKLDNGLDIITYPPLFHQLVAILSFIMPFELASKIIVFSSWILIAYFSTKFVLEYLDLKEKIFYIFPFIFFSIGLLKTIFVFGQNPFLLGTAFGFISLYHFIKFIKGKNNKDGIIFALTLSLTAFSNVLAFLVFSLTIIILIIFENSFVIKNIKSFFIPTIVFLVSFLGTSTFLISLFSNSLPSTEIYHGSRYPLSSYQLFDLWIFTSFGFTFLGFILPFLIKLKKKNILNIYFIGIAFFVLGLGLNTPLPELIFGSLSKWITYDRFILFSSIIFSSLLAISIFKINLLQKKLFLFAVTTIYIIFNLTWLFNIHTQFVGIPINYDNSNKESARNFILNFLENASTDYRFQTLGFGKSQGLIHFYTDVPTLDTEYFTGRKIEWLRNSGIEEIDSTRNINILNTFMTQASSNYSVKYIFTFNCIIHCDNFYHEFVGTYYWRLVKQKTFGNIDVIIWENKDDLIPVKNKIEKINILNVLRGVTPLITLFLLVLVFHRKW